MKQTKMLIVAAHDSSRQDKYQANYVCDGLHPDNLTIQKALDELDKEFFKDLKASIENGCKLKNES